MADEYSAAFEGEHVAEGGDDQSQRRLVGSPHVVVSGSGNNLMVFVDGHPIKGIYSLSFDAQADLHMPVLVLRLQAPHVALDVESVNVLVEANAQFCEDPLDDVALGRIEYERSGATGRIVDVVERGKANARRVAHQYMDLDAELRRHLCTEFEMFTKDEATEALLDEARAGVAFDASVITRAIEHQCFERFARAVDVLTTHGDAMLEEATREILGNRSAAVRAVVSSVVRDAATLPRSPGIEVPRPSRELIDVLMPAGHTGFVDSNGALAVYNANGFLVDEVRRGAAEITLVAGVKTIIHVSNGERRTLPLRIDWGC